MPLYGSTATVKQMLRPTEETAYGADIDDRLDAIQRVVSGVLEDKLGRTFGTTAADTTQLFWAGNSGLLLFDRPARAITSVTIGGTVTGITMTGGTVYANTLWTYDPYDPHNGLIYGLRLFSGAWGGSPATPVQIVGDFSDTDDDGNVPDDLTYAVNLIIMRTLQGENTGVGGVSGPDGIGLVPPPDPWKNPTVVAVIDKYRIGRREWVM